MQMARRRGQADRAGEHHQADHARLEQQEPVLPTGFPSRANGEIRCHQTTRGSSSKVWKGGGELTVHSSVVAPSPQ